VPGKAHCAHDCEVPDVDLFTPITIRDVTARNRIAMSPMCMYTASDGYAINSSLFGQVFGSSP
jgi:2,4-dienoyl-CoA reductase-like NADH-dependent reductase (Old Yellow Enzyme family)